MYTQKRGRACESCSKIKIKCALGKDPNALPPCERCVRLNKECVLSKPQRQKDRVQELEAQVAALTSLLQAQGIEDVSLITSTPARGQDASSPPAQQPNAIKKRKLSAGGKSDQRDGIAVAEDENGIDLLDAIVPRELQEEAFNRYSGHFTSVFPLITLSGRWTFDALRAKYPTLLQAMVYAASPGILPDQMQEDLCKYLLNTLARIAIADGEKSYELIQAIQITCTWFRSPRHHKHMAVFQFIHIADGMAVDIGIGDPAASRSALVSVICDADIATTDASRTYLTCHLLSASTSLLMRRVSLAKWSPYHEDCLLLLSYSSFTSPENRWLALYFRAERLCEQIGSTLDLSSLNVLRDVSDESTHADMQSCRTKILDWKALLSPLLQSPDLLLWEHVANAYLHELVLHTSTNKESFAAPYVSERLSTTDFPAPLVTERHVHALKELKFALHSIITLYTSLEIDVLMALPALFFTSRAVYALYVLVKLYVAIVAPGNTYGAVFRPEALELEACFEKMIAIANRLAAIDERSGPARVSSASVRLQEWWQNYSCALCDTPSMIDRSSARSSDYDINFASVELVSAKPVEEGLIDWDAYFPFAGVTGDLGLDALFADPLQADNFMFPDAFDDTAV